MRISMRHLYIALELRERFWDILWRKDFKIGGGGRLGARGVRHGGDVFAIKPNDMLRCVITGCERM